MVSGVTVGPYGSIKLQYPPNPPPKPGSKGGAGGAGDGGTGAGQANGTAGTGGGVDGGGSSESTGGGKGKYGCTDTPHKCPEGKRRRGPDLSSSPDGSKRRQNVDPSP